MAVSIRRRVGYGVASFFGVTALILAVIMPGVEVTEVNLNDGGVWVTSAKHRMLAHLNYPARLLDAGLRTGTNQFDVFQKGESVQYSDKEVGSVAPVSVATATLETAVEYGSLDTVIGGDSIALTDSEAGNVWVQPVTAMASFDPEEVDADVEGMPGAVSTVGGDGAVHVVSAQAQKTVSLIRQPTGMDRTEVTLEGLPTNASLQIAAVGGKVVVWDQENERLYLPGKRTVEIQGPSAILQDSGAESDWVILADADGLIRVPISGGEVERIPAPAPGGTPARPVWHKGCAYSAWSGSGAFLRNCVEQSGNVELVVDTLKSAKQTIFRTNREAIVLNEVNTGGLWLPDTDMILVDNWDQIESQLESEDKTDEDSVEDSTDSLLPDRSDENTPPIAVDDEFGVRAGRTTILPILLNDSDADGDFMTASALTQPSIGTVSVAREGAALQIRVEPGTTGTSTFEYEASDGRGGTATARVTVSVHGSDINSAPEQRIVPTLAMGASRSASTNALSNWVDPDGDPFYLESVEVPAGITTRFHETGTVDITDVSHGPGKGVAALFVSDGTAVGEGKINLDIKDSGNLPPTANADHLVVRVGSSATLFPLLNDTDPNGDPLRLVQIDEAPVGMSASMDSLTGAVEVTGHNVGTYYLSYVITDGPNTGPGVIRIDVVDAQDDVPPSAEDDLAILPEGGQALVDLLANDSDPSGGVLVVQSVNVPADSPVVVALVERQLLRITAPGGLSNPAHFTYTVSNGVASSEATVTVLPKPTTDSGEPPEVNDDVLVVRSGDVASVSVLANDRSPAGLRMTVMNELQHEIDPELGTVFISDNVVRVRGGTRGGSGRIVYTVTDTMGNVASAVVNLTVVPRDDSANTAPKPKELVARTVAGREVTIRVPLDGIDPEGDSVTLVGLAGAPKLGSVTQEGSAFVYTPPADAKGTDSFTYTVEDSFGMQAIGRIRVGIAPRDATNTEPVTVPDLVRVRPGTRVSVAVLSNDIDADGDTLTLAPDSLTSETAGLELTERSGRIVLTAPKDEGTYVISYMALDGNGGQALGVCTVVVTDNAPLLAPIARDDEVSLADTQASTDGFVVVDVLRNDEDPDGDVANATLTVTDPGMEVVSNGIRIKLTDAAQTLIYTVTDTDSISASAVIRVPGVAVTRPQIDTRTLPIRVRAGESKVIHINDHIQARDGRSVQLTGGAKATAGPGWDGSTLVTDSRTLTFGAARGFSGMTQVVIEVTDGADLNDNDALVATLSLPIQVEPGENRPPVVTPTGIEVAPGEDAVRVDMALWISDPDGDAPAGMTYRVVNAPQGIDAAAAGQVLNVSAAAGTQRGSAGAITVEVTDQSGNAVTAQVPVTVVSSSRPLIQTTPAEVTLNAGESQTVDVSNFATNPFADRGPLSLVGQPTVSGGGTATASGTQVTFGANVGFNGTFTITYRLLDATNDPSREVQGTITATVRDRPGAPTNVTAVSNSEGSALIAWTGGAANGSPITGYTVTDHTQGDSQECGLVTQCLMLNRTNGIDHTFSVTATNEVGTSDPSNQTTVNIDIEPETPAAPTLVAGDRSLTVSWTPPRSRGSAIAAYELAVSPGGTVEVSGSQTSHTLTGLTNGANYTVTIRARNAKGDSQWSAPSLAVKPYGRPGPVRGLRASYDEIGAGTGSTATVIVEWQEPGDTNGRDIESYTVSSGSVTKTVTGTSTALEGVALSANQVTFTVTATNDVANAAQRTSDPASVSTWVVGQPLPPTLTSVSATGNHAEASLAWQTSPSGQGWSNVELYYEWSPDGQQWKRLDGNIAVGGGLQNGVTSNVRIRACGTKTGTAYCSPPTSGLPVTPFGHPVPPQVWCQPSTRPGGIECGWYAADASGRESETKVVLSASVNETLPFSATGARFIDVGEGREGGLCVTLVQTTPEAGHREAAGGCRYATGSSYAREFRTEMGSATSPAGPCQANCHWLRLVLNGWPPNSTVNCSGPVGGVTYSGSFQVNGDGNYSGEGRWNGGGYTGAMLIGASVVDFSQFFDSLSCSN